MGIVLVRLPIYQIINVCANNLEIKKKENVTVAYISKYNDHTYPVITLCGSTKFKKEFEEMTKHFTLEGWIVLGVGCFGHSDGDFWTEGTKKMLDDMHKAKIEMADAIFVIDKNHYIGASTRQEITYAMMLNKEIYYYTDFKGDENDVQ